MKALTDENFKQKLKKVNPKVIVTGKYKNRITKIEFACYKCGKIQSTFPQNLFKHSGLCSECSNKEVADHNAKGHAQFISELKKRNPTIKVTGKYVNAYTKIEWECHKCGMKQFSRPTSLFTSKGLCKKCMQDSRFYTDAQFKEKIKKLNPNINVTGTYVDSNTKIEWKCNVCGEKQYSNPKYLHRLSGICSKCRNSHKREEFYNEFKKLATPPKLLTPYINVTTKVKCLCNVCGYVWESLPNVILTYKNPCPQCAKLSRCTDKEEFKNRLEHINPKIELLSDYKRNYLPVKCKCLLCGNIFSTRPNDLLRGKGCPECNHTSTSFVEQFLLISLRDVLGDTEVISRDKKAIGKELDIYIPKKYYAIEYGSWFWHKDRVENDQDKIIKCKSKNIKLLCIYDSCHEEVNLANTIIYKEDLSQNLDIVKKILLRIFAEFNIKCSFSENQWNKIKEKAYIQSRRMTTDEFMKELRKVNGDVEVLEEYKGANTLIKVKCKKCGNIWKVKPRELLKGVGCLKCYRLRQFDSQEIFQTKVAKINPNVEILGAYKGRKNRIETKCKICGHIWNPLANNLAQGKGCPNCRKNKRK